MPGKKRIHTARLENWCTMSRGVIDPCTAPELVEVNLHGNTYDDRRPHFPDGLEITTTKIVKIDWEKRRAITASGSIYHLGVPNPNWIKYLEDHGNTKSLALINSYKPE